jgi:hypothetical protein
MEKRVYSWYKTLDGKIFLIHGRIAGRPHICPCHCHQEPDPGVKIFVSCSHCQPEQQGGALRDIEAFVKHTLLTIRSMPFVIEEDTLIAAACSNILEKIAAYVRELLPEKEPPVGSEGAAGQAYKQGWNDALAETAARLTAKPRV